MAYLSRSGITGKVRVVEAFRDCGRVHGRDRQPAQWGKKPSDPS
jgi:hypothetical protein